MVPSRPLSLVSLTDSMPRRPSRLSLVILAGSLARVGPRAVLVATASLLVAGAAWTAVVWALPSGTRPTPEAVRPCSSRGDSNRPQQLPAPVGARIGPLVIWPSIRDRVQDSGPGQPWAFYVKAPIVLPARAKVTLAVAPEAKQLLGFQSAAGWVSSVRFEACRENVRAYPRAYIGTVGKYTGFPFGFGLARRSLCATLEVWVQGSATPIRRRVPFGRSSCS
jgi:hypothetical protein